MNKIKNEIEELVKRANQAQDNNDMETMKKCDERLLELYEEIGLIPKKPKVRTKKINK